MSSGGAIERNHTPHVTYRAGGEARTQPGWPRGWLREPGPDEPKPPRLMERVRQAIETRHLSRRTEKAYAGWIRRFILFHGKRHPIEMGERHVTAFLSSLVRDRHVSASTQNQALAAILFLYRDVLGRELDWLDSIVRAKRPVRLPVVLTHEQVAAVLAGLRGVMHIQASLLYGAGLRLTECVRLRVKDVDLYRSQIVVRDGKGAKDRVTLLPDRVRSPLAQHLERVRQLHNRDLERGLGSVELPFALGTKYPNADREWGWQWLFPATRFYCDSETGQRRRHHLHESVLQRVVKDAVRRAGITVPATCHTPLVRNPHVGERLRHPHDPGAVGAQRCENDPDLHTRSEPWGPWRQEPP